MELIPLGCVAGMPSDGHASSGYLVRHADTTIMLDAGPGTAVHLSRRLAAGSLSAICISHRHTDHILDLLPIGKMVLADRLTRDTADGPLALDEAVPRVPLFVPKGTHAVLRRYADLFPVATHPLLDQAFEIGFDVREYQPGDVVTIGGLTVRFELLAHIAPNCGMRIEGGDRSLVYTGDTGVTEALTHLARGAGALLSECTLHESDTTSHGHLSSTDAGRAARAAGVGELILTHFSSTAPEDLAWHHARAAAEFGGPIHLATPDHTYVIPLTRKVPA